jgi:hypothetical protein
MAVEPYMLRYDLKRAEDKQTTTTHNPNGPSGTTTTVTKRPYAETGVYLGNGLMMDQNLNLFVDMVRFFGMADRDSFTITDNRGKDLKPTQFYERTGNVFTSKKSAAAKPSRKVEFAGDKILIEDGSILKIKKTVNITPTTLEIPAALGASRVVQETSSRVEFTGSIFAKGAGYSFEQTSPDFITVKVKMLLGTRTAMEIARRDDCIVFIYKPAFSLSLLDFRKDETYTFFRTENGFYFSRDAGSFLKQSVIQVEKRDNSVLLHDYLLFGDQVTTRVIVQ